MTQDWVPYLGLGCAVVAGAIILQLLVQLIVYPFFHPLSKFHGSYWGSVSRLWMAYEFWKGTELSTLQKLHEKHGRHFRIRV